MSHLSRSSPCTCMHACRFSGSYPNSQVAYFYETWHHSRGVNTHRDSNGSFEYNLLGTHILGKFTGYFTCLLFDRALSGHRRFSLPSNFYCRFYTSTNDLQATIERVKGTLRAGILQFLNARKGLPQGLAANQ